jgi:glutaredoxin
MYTDECPNCKIVKEYMNETNTEQKLIDLQISLEKINMDNPTSIAYLKKATKECEISITSVGVPFVYFNKECYIGRIEVIDMLNKTISDIN